jgi:hypothetical protein
MNKAPQITIISITLYCLLCAAYIIFVLYNFILDHHKAQTTTDFILLFALISPATVGLILSWLSTKGYKCARYTLGSYLILSIFFVFFLPFAQHEIDRTTGFYAICIISIISFVLLAYSLFINKGSVNYLSSKR